MKIEDRPEFKSKAKPLTALATDTVSAAAAAMSERNFGSVVVVDDTGKIVGMFTERDLLRRVIAHGRDPKATPLADVMTKEIKIATATDEVIDWLRQMSNERFRHVPVVDANGSLVHMMSQGDFVSYTWPDLISRVKDEVTHAYPKVSSAIWLFGGLAVYTVVIIAALRSSL